MPEHTQTVYHNFYEITELQQYIMHMIDDWCHSEKTPIPQAIIIEGMDIVGSKEGTVVRALNGLIKLGYIRKAIVFTNVIMKNKNLKGGKGNNTYYVMLRRI
jgi:hypothetical protein